MGELLYAFLQALEGGSRLVTRTLVYRFIGMHSQCSGLQAGGEANLVAATRSVAVSFRRCRTLLVRDGDGSFECSR